MPIPSGTDWGTERPGEPGTAGDDAGRGGIRGLLDRRALHVVGTVAAVVAIVSLTSFLGIIVGSCGRDVATPPSTVVPRSYGDALERVNVTADAVSSGEAVAPGWAGVDEGTNLAAEDRALGARPLDGSARVLPEDMPVADVSAVPPGGTVPLSGLRDPMTGVPLEFITMEHADVVRLRERRLGREAADMTGGRGYNFGLHGAKVPVGDPFVLPRWLEFQSMGVIAWADETGVSLRLTGRVYNGTGLDATASRLVPIFANGTPVPSTVTDEPLRFRSSSGYVYLAKGLPREFDLVIYGYRAHVSVPERTAETPVGGDSAYATAPRVSSLDQAFVDDVAARIAEGAMMNDAVAARAGTDVTGGAVG